MKVKVRSSSHVPAIRHRYSKVSRKIWNDAKFRKLSAPPPCGQFLWLRLLTGPELTTIPGIFTAGRAALAEALGWTVEGFDVAYREVLREGLAEGDWEARLVWVPKALDHNRPESPNVVRSWRLAWDELPDCELKMVAYESLKSRIVSYGSTFAEAFREAFGEGWRQPSPYPSPYPSPHPSPNQIQEQEQEQDLNPENICAGAGAPARVVSESPEPGPKSKTASVTQEPDAPPSAGMGPKRRGRAQKAARVAEDLFDASKGHPGPEPAEIENPVEKLTSAQRYAQAFARGISAGKGGSSPTSLPDDRFGAIARAVLTHAREHAQGPALRGAALLQWIEASTERWVRTCPSVAQRWGGYSPKAWLEWLDAGALPENVGGNRFAPAVVRQPASTRESDEELARRREEHARSMQEYSEEYGHLDDGEFMTKMLEEVARERGEAIS